MEGALLIFFDEYSQWPVTAEDGLIDHKEVLPLLLGEKSGSLNQNQNPQGLKFLELDQASYIDGVFVDAWGNPYSVVVDSDYDGFVKVGEHMVKKTVVAWSLGPNGINEFGLGDDISSYDFASE